MREAAGKSGGGRKEGEARTRRRWCVCYAGRETRGAVGGRGKEEVRGGAFAHTKRQGAGGGKGEAGEEEEGEG
eukprot:364937-Chlamydomonas_euryale.AAC.22